MSDGSPQYCILIYSKYSEICKNAIPLAKRSAQIKLLCADNKLVRERLKSSKIGIKYIPTILLIFVNGTVEKYEGSHVIKVLEHVVNTENPVQPKPQPQLNKPKFLRKQPKQPEPEEDEIEEEDDGEEIMVPIQKPIPKPKPKQKSKMRKQPVVPVPEPEEEIEEATPIEDLLDETEEEDIETGLKFSDKLEKPLAKNDKRPMTNSMSIAQQIAKERDIEEQLIDSKKAKGRR